MSISINICILNCVFEGTSENGTFNVMIMFINMVSYFVYRPINIYKRSHEIVDYLD